jgi:hypothetical protein
VLGLVQDHFRSRPEPIAHFDPARAVELGFLFTVAAVREAVLFDNIAGLATPGDDELATELARFFLGYLTTSQPGAVPARLPRPSFKRRRSQEGLAPAGRRGIRKEHQRGP